MYFTPFFMVKKFPYQPFIFSEKCHYPTNYIKSGKIIMIPTIIGHNTFTFDLTEVGKLAHTRRRRTVRALSIFHVLDRNPWLAKMPKGMSMEFDTSTFTFLF